MSYLVLVEFNDGSKTWSHHFYEDEANEAAEYRKKDTTAVQAVSVIEYSIIRTII